MDIILLIILKKVRKLNSTTLRIISAGIVGGINACVIALLPNLNTVIKFTFTYILTTYLMVRIAYRFINHRELIKNIIMLFIITFFLGGFLNSLYYYTNLGYFFRELFVNGLLSDVKVKFLLLSPVIIVVVRLFIKAFEETKYKTHNIYEVEIKYNDRSLKLKGLYDTGNSLKDPISKKPVAIAEYDSVKNLLPEKLRDTIEAYLNTGFLDHNTIGIEYATSIRLIPYKSIGKENGMLLGVIFNEVMVHSIDEIANNKLEENSNNFVSNNMKTIIAMHNGKLSNNEDYQVILHKELL